MLLCPKCLRKIHRRHEETTQDPAWCKGVTHTRPSAPKETAAHRSRRMLAIKIEKQKEAHHSFSVLSLGLEPVPAPRVWRTAVYVQSTWETKGESDSERRRPGGGGGTSHSLFPEPKILDSQWFLEITFIVLKSSNLEWDNGDRCLRLWTD